MLVAVGIVVDRDAEEVGTAGIGELHVVILVSRVPRPPDLEGPSTPVPHARGLDVTPASRRLLEHLAGQETAGLELVVVLVSVASFLRRTGPGVTPSLKVNFGRLTSLSQLST
jgi:hypothetical protein